MKELSAFEMKSIDGQGSDFENAFCAGVGIAALGAVAIGPIGWLAIGYCAGAVLRDVIRD